MNETMIAMSGVVVTDLKKGEARGASVVSFRLLSTVRRWERGKGWYDADHNFVTVTCWRGLADNVSSSVKRGDPLLVVGRMRVRPWDTADREGSTVEIEANSIGHDLSRGTSAFRKHRDAEPERTDGDEQLKQVRWHVEEQSRSAERAVFDARRSGANVPPDLTALALAGGVGGAPTALAPADGVGEGSNGESPGNGATHGDAAAANGEAGKPASAARSRERISTGA
jgi:single-strand DNA-binding protein